MQSITWDLPKLMLFREAHRQALSSGLPTFTFQDNGQGYQFVTQYAGYLIEYVAGELQGVKAKRSEPD